MVRLRPRACVVGPGRDQVPGAGDLPRGRPRRARDPQLAAVVGPEAGQLVEVQHAAGAPTRAAAVDVVEPSHLARLTGVAVRAELPVTVNAPAVDGVVEREPAGVDVAR